MNGQDQAEYCRWSPSDSAKGIVLSHRRARQKAPIYEYQALDRLYAVGRRRTREPLLTTFYPWLLPQEVV